MSNTISNRLREMNREYFEQLDQIRFYIKFKNLKKTLRQKRLLEVMALKINKKKYFDQFEKKELDSHNYPKNNKKFVVYMCVLGAYDQLLEPVLIEENTDYFIFTDMDVPKDSIWKKIPIDKSEFGGLSCSEINRFIKLHPQRYFGAYEYSLYIDGNVRIIGSVREIVDAMIYNNKLYAVHRHPDRDCIYTEANYLLHMKRFKEMACKIKAQVEMYKKNNFERHQGLYENTIIFRKHNDPRCIELMEEWWRQLTMYSMRDQISFPYAMKVCGWEEKDIEILGYNLKRNDRFRYYSHEK